MKTLILWMLMLAIASVSNAQNVNIPDTAFLCALIDKGVDTNGDSLISYAEAESVTSVNVGENIETYACFVSGICQRGEISDLTGLEAFINLDSLDIQGNRIDNLDLSMNKNLRYLNCSNNYLTSLDVSNYTALEYLQCSSNQLTGLDISNNTALEHLECIGNQLTSLDVSNNTALAELICGEAQLTSLDVSNNTALENLECSENQLTSLDLSNNIALYYISLCDMPTLHEVRVWTMPFPPADVELETDGSHNWYPAYCAVNIPDKYTVNSTINICPNPSDDIINIEIENINNATLDIFNVNGNLIFSKELDSKFEKVGISHLSEGIYFVKVRQENNIRIEKLIIY